MGIVARRFRVPLLIVGISLTASVVLTSSRFYYAYTVQPKNFLVNDDFVRHSLIMKGNAEAPLCYRVLTEYALEAFCRISRLTMPEHYPQVAFVFKVVQNFIVFLSLSIYLRSGGMTGPAILLGVFMFALASHFSFYSSDLAYSTFSEMIFLFLSGYAINRGASGIQVVLLTVVAALNRETAVFIPGMYLANTLFCGWKYRSLKENIELLHSKSTGVGVVAILSFLAVYVGLRLLIVPNGYSGSRYGAVYPGLHLAWLNIVNYRTWRGLLWMYGILPFTLLYWTRWPSQLRAYAIVCGIPWFAVQFLFGSTDETRLFLTPLGLILIPASLRLVAGAVLDGHGKQDR